MPAPTQEHAQDGTGENFTPRTARPPQATPTNRIYHNAERRSDGRRTRYAYPSSSTIRPNAEPKRRCLPSPQSYYTKAGRRDDHLPGHGTGTFDRRTCDRSQARERTCRTSCHSPSLVPSSRNSQSFPRHISAKYSIDSQCRQSVSADSKSDSTQSRIICSTVTSMRLS